MTKREMFNAAIAIVEGREIEVDRVALVEGLSHEIELLDNRKTNKKGLTKTQKENEGVKAVIAEVLADTGEKMTVTELINDGRLNGYTNQKISALLRQMVETGKVVKTIEGKKAFFEVAVE